MAGLDWERQEKAKSYARIIRPLAFLEIGIAAFFILILLITPLSISLRDLLDFAQPLRVALYFTTIMLCFAIISAPLSFYRGFILPRKFGLLNQRLSGWLIDGLKAGVLGLILGLGIMVFIYWLLASFPDLWWLMAAAFLILLTAVMTNLSPIIIVSLFYRMEPIADISLGERLVRLAERAGEKVVGVFTINLSSKATTSNAAIMGLGNTRRIVIGDTIIEEYSHEEIEVIVAHELGHHVHRDIVKLIVLQAVVILSGFYMTNLILKFGIHHFGFNGVSDVAAFSLLAIALGGVGILMTPLTCAYNRHVESAADEYALNLTHNPGGFIKAMSKLANQNLSEAKPARWVEIIFYDHPPYFRRVARACQYEEEV